MYQGMHHVRVISSGRVHQCRHAVLSASQRQQIDRLTYSQTNTTDSSMCYPVLHIEASATLDQRPHSVGVAIARCPHKRGIAVLHRP
jgi:hypothetical protein